MSVKSIDQMDLDGKRVLLRAEFNVPVNDEGVITDDTRIRAALPTINRAIEQGAKLIIVSHRGRPKGERVPKFTQKPSAERLTELLGKPVMFVDECVGPKVEEAVADMEPGDVVLLENVRYYPGEEKLDEEFAQQLASVADVYINDAFGCAHRTHASTYAVAKYVHETGVGYLMQKELDAFDKALANPDRPCVLVIGGAKVSGKDGKIWVIKNLLGKVDKVLMGGKIAFTFLAARGKTVGNSLGDADADADAIKNDVQNAQEGLEEAADLGKEIVLPVDCIVADKFADDAESKTVSVDEIPDGWLALDIGPETVERFAEEIANAKTIIWNGPMGVFEMEKFKQGTVAVANEVAESDAMSLIGGGDSVAAINEAGVADKIGHISTGGGAMLQLLMGKELPGVAVLSE